MSNIKGISKSCILGGAVALAVLGWCSGAEAKKALFEVVHAFNGSTDGYYSYAPLLSDKSGNLFGTASAGGANGYGTVFEIAPDGTENVLHSFTYADGDVPYGGLIRDASGNLYGTTYQGGAQNYGAVFELARDGTETVLHSFTGSDGANPESSLIKDKSGNLYGTAAQGGIGCCNGTVFKIAPGGTETTLYQFTGGSDGGIPQASLIMDKAGNLYSTASVGGSVNCGNSIGCGVVFMVTPSGTESVLYTFTANNSSDGYAPDAALIADKSGNFYSTTAAGGTTNNGTVFKLAPNGTETVLYSFQGGTDGSVPYSPLMLDKNGNLFGTTYYGGTNNCGTVFEVSSTGTETILYSFTCGSDGAGPDAGLTRYHGRFYSTATNGGDTNCPGGCGVVFSLKRPK